MSGGLTAYDGSTYRRFFSRALLIGGPNSWKTSSLRTWPRPLHIVSVPGEHGVSSIPQEDGISAMVWEPSDTLKTNRSMYKAVRDYLVEVIAGKHGQFATLAVDGLHKVYDLSLEAHWLELGADSDDRKGGAAYGAAHKEVGSLISQLVRSPMSNLVMTVWAKNVKDDPKDRKSDEHLFAALPGTFKDRVLGEFGCVLGCEPGRQKATPPGEPLQFTPGVWYTRPAGKWWGVGVKLPLQYAAKVPTKVPQNWAALEKLVFGVETTKEETK